MNQHLSIPLDSFIELLIRNLSILNANLVTYNEGRLGLAGDDEVS